MHKHGGDIYSNTGKIDFSANINPLGMPLFVINAAKIAVDKSYAYPDVLYRDLAAAISERESVPKESIICGNGAAELVFALCFGLLPKKAVLICPSFQEYRQALIACGCDITDYYLKEEKNFQLDEDYLDCLTEDIDMIFICNPNNPTGNLIDKELMNKILEKCQEQNIFPVIDECFNDFLEDGESFAVKEENVFILKAFTKMYGMAGLRLGYGICSNAFILEKMRGCVQPWSVSTVAQQAGIKAAEDRLFAETTRKIIQEEKEFLLKEISSLAEKVYGFTANYIFFKSNDTLYEDLLDKGILIRDCSNFQGLSKGYYRIAIKNREDNEKLIKAWKEVNKWQKA